MGTEGFFLGVVQLRHQSNHSPLNILWFAQEPLHLFFQPNTAAAGSGGN
jgi:hypothetical protein